jgi:hypoxanthine phosphoribosyltransferase
MATKFYTDINETSEKVAITQELSIPVEGKNVLLVDDVSDRDKTQHDKEAEKRYQESKAHGLLKGNTCSILEYDINTKFYSQPSQSYLCLFQASP